MLLPDAEVLASAMDAFPDHLALLNADGIIRWTNRAWREFGLENGASADENCIGVSYLAVCGADDTDTNDRGSASVEPVPERGGMDPWMLSQLAEVIRGNRMRFEAEYPCHSPEADRWFTVRAERIDKLDRRMTLVSHHDITKRRLSELRALELAYSDPLTGIPNRRSFDDEATRRWETAGRSGHRVTIAVIDIDDFKAHNDRRGHASGDRVLQQVADAIDAVARRADDIAARIGGDEFAIFFGDCDEANAARLMGQVVDQLRCAGGEISLSVGIASTLPPGREASDGATSLEQLVARADFATFEAKRRGRDQLVRWSDIESDRHLRR